MALTPQNLFRAQDVGTSTKLGPITPKNWRVKHGKTVPLVDANENAAKPRYNQADYAGGVYGDLPNSTANVAVARDDGGANEPDYAPRTQNQKATILNTVPVQDVGRNPGWIAPGEPYKAPPAAGLNPTLTTLSPNTAVAGKTTPQFVMKLTGTNFTPYSEVLLAGNKAPLFTYISATEMRVQMSPASSVAGTTSVEVVDHGVKTAASTFTWT
jgi:hypothetical protein